MNVSFSYSWFSRRFARAVVVALATSVAAAGCGDITPEAGDRGAATRWGGDLIAAGRTLTISDSIPGDVMVAGAELTFSGVAGGDYLGAGGRQRIGGRVLGDARIAGGELLLTGEVANNATIAGGRIRLGEGSTIRGNAYLAGSNIRVEGTVSGSLRAAGEDVTLSGIMGGNVVVEADSLRVGPGARIQGDLRYRVPPEHVEIAEGAEITGEVIARAARPDRDLPIGLFRVVWMLGFLLAGAVAVAFFPGTAATAESALRDRTLPALGWGLVWVIGVPIAAAIIAMTVIGVPLALIVMLLYLISLYLGRAVTAVWIGRLILRGWAREERGRLVVAFLTGGLILLLLGLIPVLGALVTFVATVAGLGALVEGFRAPQETES